MMTWPTVDVAGKNVLPAIKRIVPTLSGADMKKYLMWNALIAVVDFMESFAKRIIWSVQVAGKQRIINNGTVFVELTEYVQNVEEQNGETINAVRTNAPRVAKLQTYFKISVTFNSQS